MESSRSVGMLTEEETFAFLRNWEISKDDLLAHSPEVGDTEALALIGSIVEGLANEESDVDILYLGDSPLKDKITMQMDSSYTFGVSHDRRGREINVEQLTTASLKDLGARVGSSLEVLNDLRKWKGHYIERNHNRLKMLHRIKTAMPLKNGHVLQAWQEFLQSSKFHKFLCLILVQDLMNLREDIAGEVNAGKLESAMWMTRFLYGPKLVASLLASAGETNANVKWHFRLFRRYEDVLGTELIEKVMEFAYLDTARLEHDLLGKIAAINELVIDSIYSRQREVRKALVAFSLGVRYLDPENPSRWARG
jgi:Nucleotidyltransferase domain